MQRPTKRAAGACVFAFFVTGCMLADFPVDFKLVQTTPHPVDKVEVALVSADAGATSSTAYHFLLRRKGETNLHDGAMLIIDKSDPEDISIRWDGDTIRIKLKSGRIFKKFDRMRLDGKAYEVSVVGGKDV